MHIYAVSSDKQNLTKAVGRVVCFDYPIYEGIKPDFINTWALAIGRGRGPNLPQACNWLAADHVAIKPTVLSHKFAPHQHFTPLILSSTNHNIIAAKLSKLVP